jgi:DNA-binding MarR family transcriptional regulator
VTGLIDRLERAGVARRRIDTTDRRRVLVETAEGALPIAEQYQSLQADALGVLGRRDETELTVIADYLRDMYELAVQHVARLERRADGA